jgi:hypothetical protein
MRGLCAEAEGLCRAVAPDVAQRPLYVFLRSDLPSVYQTGDGPEGCTLRHLDLILQPVLERLGRWRGRGPAMVLDPQTIAASAQHRPRASRRRAFRPSVMGIVLHELAHILSIGPDEADPPVELIAAGRSLLVAELNGIKGPTNGPGAAIPWRWHEWSFIRTVLHLAHRAALLGIKLMPADVFDASDYGLSSTWRYLAALGDEPGRLVDRDFAMISMIPPPSVFVELWEADVCAWMSR